jgi:hypothetical protein
VRKSCKGFLHINHAQSIKKRNIPPHSLYGRKRHMHKKFPKCDIHHITWLCCTNRS